MVLTVIHTNKVYFKCKALNQNAMSRDSRLKAAALSRTTCIKPSDFNWVWVRNDEDMIVQAKSRNKTSNVRPDGGLLLVSVFLSPFKASCDAV